MVFDKVEDVWQFKMVSCGSPWIKLATYSLACEVSHNFDNPGENPMCPS